jgi:hypothetical protein
MLAKNGGGLLSLLAFKRGEKTTFLLEGVLYVLKKKD